MRTTLGMVSLVGLTLGAAAAQADGILVNIQPVVLQSPSGIDVATGAPPTSDAEVGEGSAFVIELWAQQAVSDPNYFGLGCVFADLTYDNANMSCAGTTPGAAFDNMLASGTCDNGAGMVDELGGCTFEFPGPGIPPDWVRIASVDMTADVISAGNVITSSPADSGVSVYFQVVPVGQVTFGATPSFSIIPPVLSLNPDQLCYAGGVGDTITVTVDMSDAATLVVGAQFFLEYDPNTLDFISIGPGDPPFTLEIFESVDEGLGTIDYSVGATFGDPGTSADSTMAVITFEALAEYCQTAGLIAFREHVPPNRLSAEGGGALNPALNDLPEISIDGTDPLISGCPGTVAADNDAGLCSAVVNWTAPTASDNCALQSFTATHDPGETFPVGTTPVTYTATDECGNTATCSFDVIVSDNEAPTISCPADVSTTADAGLCSAGGVVLGTPTTGDNCGVDPASNNAPGLYPVGDTIVTWTVTDVNGNSNTCDQTVTVTDDELPAITCPADVSISADAGLCTASGVVLGTPTTSDNCGVNPASDNAPALFPVGDTIVTWTVTDINGNSNSCDQTVTVTDDELPTITCPADLSETADAGECFASGIMLGTPTTSDDCGVDTVSNNAPAQFPVGDTIVTWTVTDISGNSNTCDQLVTVTDDEAPAITCPADVSVSTDAGLCLASGVALGTPTTSDNCGVDTVSSNAPTLFLLGDTIVTWTVTDIHGSSNTCDQTVTVTDDELPAITCPADVSVGVDTGLCSASGVVLGTPTTSDNCGVDTVGNDAPALFPVGDTIVTWTVTDVNGNGNTCDQLVTVTEDEDPVISGCPLDIMVNADAGGCDALVTWTEPTASDNCGVTSFVSTHAPGDVFPEGTTTVTYTAEDAAGNLATCSFDVTVIGVNELVVSLELSPTVATPLTRCITFELWECGFAPQVIKEEITFINGVGNALFEVPCGDYSCMTARDELHTLRRTLFRAGGGDFDVVGTQYVADFVAAGEDLIGGNLNDDFWIDILDFGVFSSEWGVNYGTGDTTCTTPFPHADMSGDGFVLIGDFSFIQIHFGQGSEANCCGEPDAALTPGGGPTTQISVNQLEQLGLPDLAAGDLNGDGWLDEADIAEFIQGARPRALSVPVKGVYDSAPLAPPAWRR